MALDLNLADRNDMFGVRCRHGHVSYYDRRRVCSEGNEFMRESFCVGEHRKERFFVPCRTEGCSERRLVLELDCAEFGR